jgi:hypothetical protein
VPVGRGGAAVELERVVAEEAAEEAGGGDKEVEEEGEEDAADDVAHDVGDGHPGPVDGQGDFAAGEPQDAGDSAEDVAGDGGVGPAEDEEEDGADEGEADNHGEAELAEFTGGGGPVNGYEGHGRLVAPFAHGYARAPDGGRGPLLTGTLALP